jgi:hypothetical protein
MKTRLLAPEVAEQLRKAVNGEVEVKLFRPRKSKLKRVEEKLDKVPQLQSWNEVYAGNVEFAIGDWRVIIFNDCNELDYIDSAFAPNRLKGTFDSWSENPLRYLTTAEQTQLELLLERAK